MGNSFDTKGFKFVLKASMIIVALFVLVQIGSEHIQDFQNHARAYIASVLEQTNKPEKDAGAAEEEEAWYPLERRTIAVDTIEDHVPAEGKFIGINLDSMTLYTYENGEVAGEYTILSKGRPGSKWETPGGSYSVLYKNEAHFSSIGKVYMPYSMQFYGNFFIHGWPYYPDGTDVDEGYSGGCVRLSTPDSEKVFEFAGVNTPIFVFETEDDEDGKPPRLELQNIAPPTVSAASYLVADLETGEVFLEKNADEERSIASISKLMTALVANETISYDKIVPISAHAIETYGTAGELVANEYLTVDKLFYPLLLESSNDAATAIAEYLGEDRFRELMNRKAMALGMTSTKFGDPSGLSAFNTSTPNDLYRLAKYIFEKKRYVFETTTLLEKSIISEGYRAPYTFYNNNPMRGRPDFVGGKNGYTDEARKTLLSLFSMNLAGNERTIAIIVLGSEDHSGDTLKLHSWLIQAASNSIDS